MLSAQKDAFQAAVNDAPLPESLGVLVRVAIQQMDGDARCVVYIANSEGTDLHHVVGVPESYHVEGFKIGPESLAGGLAVATGRPVITPDVLVEPRWSRWLWLAKQHDYRACWFFPLKSSTGTPVGTFAMYFREPREPAPQDLALAETLAQTASIIISRHQEAEQRALAGHAVRASEAHMAAVLNQIPGAVYLIDRQGRFLLRAGTLSNICAHDFIPSRVAESMQRLRGFQANGEPLPRSEYPGVRALRGEIVMPGVDFIFAADDGREMWIRVSATPFRDAAGEIVGAIAILQDIDETKRNEARLRESEARLQAAVDLAKLGCYSWNRQTLEIQWDDAVRAMWGLPPGAPVSEREWRAGLHLDDRARVERAFRETFLPGASRSVELEYRVIGLTDGVERWIAARGQILSEKGKADTVFGVVRDVTERKRAEQANLLMISELQHRTRNLLALVSAIASDTLAASNSLADFSAKFGSRLAALSRVMGLLSRGDVTPVMIGELVRMELQAHGAEPDGRRVTIEGPDVVLPKRSVQILALALHELATNARKHGALAAPRGRLAISWRTIDDESGRRLVIEWRESGAVAGKDNAASSTRKGFGRTLIEEALPYQLHAPTRLQFGPAGIFCSVTVSLGSTQAGAGD